MEELKVNKADIVKAYNTGSKETKEALVKLFGEEVFKFDYYNIKTFSDACEKLGIKKDLLISSGGGDIEAQRQAQALYKLLIIQKAMNNGVWHDEKGWSYYPCWMFYSKKGMERMSEEEKQRKGVRQLFSCADMYHTGLVGVRYAAEGVRAVPTTTDYVFPLCFNSQEAARYAAKQFEDIFFDYYGIKVKK